MSWEPSAIGLLLVLFRCSGLVMTAPLFSTHTVPMRVRMALSLVLSFVAWTSAGAPAFAAWQNWMPLLGAVFTETLIGLSAGLAARFAIEAAGAAGHAAGLSMGLGFSAIIDPINGQDSNALSNLMIFVSLGAAVASGVHRDAIAWFCRSLIETPPGTAVTVAELAGAIISAAAQATSLSIRLAFPIMAAVLFGYIGAGVLSRTAPQLNLNNVGFAIALLCGGGALYYVSPFFAEVVARQARATFTGG